MLDFLELQRLGYKILAVLLLCYLVKMIISLLATGVGHRLTLAYPKMVFQVFIAEVIHTIQPALLTEAKRNGIFCTSVCISCIDTSSASIIGKDGFRNSTSFLIHKLPIVMDLYLIF